MKFLEMWIKDIDKTVVKIISSPSYQYVNCYIDVELCVFDWLFIDSFIDLFFCKLATCPLRDTAIHIDVDEDVT